MSLRLKTLCGTHLFEIYGSTTPPPTPEEEDMSTNPAQIVKTSITNTSLIQPFTLNKPAKDILARK